MQRQYKLALSLYEEMAANVLWQIRRSRNRPEDAIFRDFRSGNGVSTVSLAYQPSPPVAALARRLGAVIGPNPPVAMLHDVKSLDYDASAWRKVGQNQEKGGVLSILCGARAFDRQFSLEVRFPFQVVLVTTPLLRRFIPFFDQFHLEQTSPFGHHDQINTVAIRSNLPQRNRTMVSLEECGPGRLALTALRGGRPVAITYSLDATRGTLSRSETGGPRKMFQPTGLVAAIRFSALPSVHEARTVVMALDLVARPTGSKAPASELTIVDQFTTRSLEAPFEHVP